MGVRRSEYRHSFVRTPDSALATDYESKLDYRLTRRSAEHRHTPFEWNDVSDDSDYESGREEEDRKREEEERRMREKEQRREKRREERRRKREALEDEGHRRPGRREGEERRDEDDEVTHHRHHKHDRHDTHAPARSRHHRHCVEEEPRRARRPVKPMAYRTIPKPSPLEASSKRPAKQECLREPVALFVPFGKSDRERETGALKTFNVRSSADVYPSALRARKRLDADIARREERARQRPYRQQQELAMTSQPRVTSSPWDSEYKQTYQGYDQGEYHRCRTPGIGGARFYVPL